MRMSRRMGIYASGGGPLWLYDAENGGDIIKNTGGLVSTNTSYISLMDDYIQFVTIKNSSSGFNNTLTTTNKIDFSKLDTLNVRRTRNSGFGGSSSNYGIPILQALNADQQVVASVTLGADYADTVVSLDVSSVTGDGYVRIYLDNPKNVSQMTWTYVTQIWGE